MSLTFCDLFCGAGGSINGFVDAGMTLIVGANHSKRAIETVSTNHPDADFLCCDINKLDKRRLPRTDILWASVICTEMSPAGGTRKRRGQGMLDLEEQGHVPSEVYERTRACALDVIQATEIHRYLAVVVENVVEFARDWELYDWWLDGMRQLGYNVQVVNVSAAHVYGDGNAPAPQWRDRIYIIFTRKGVRLPDVAPRPPSWCDQCANLVDGAQTWKNAKNGYVGKYGQQYLYRCPIDQTVVEPLVLPAISAIGTRIGDRERPLAPKTMARIEWGVHTFAEPVIAAAAGNTYEHGEYRRGVACVGSAARDSTDDGMRCHSGDADNGERQPRRHTGLPGRGCPVADTLNEDRRRDGMGPVRACQPGEQPASTDHRPAGSSDDREQPSADPTVHHHAAPQRSGDWRQG